MNDFAPIDVKIVSNSEPWSEVLLADGTLIRARLLITSVAQLPGQKNELGEPVFLINAAQSVHVISSPVAQRIAESASVFHVEQGRPS